MLETFDRLSIGIVVPCYNEENSICELVSQFSQSLLSFQSESKYHSIYFKLILVDNGSSDLTRSIISEVSMINKFVDGVYIDKNIGYGNGILKGLEYLNGMTQIVGYTHADLQCDPGDIFRALSAYSLGHNNFIKGRRYGRPFVDRFFTKGMSILETLLFQKRLSDINAQPTIFDSSLYDNFINPPIDFSLDLYNYLLAIQSNFLVSRIPVLFGPRKYGNSSWNTGFKARIGFIKRTLKFSLSLRSSILSKINDK